MTDPYSLPGESCLRNKLGVTDPEQLKQIEARLVSVRDVELARETLPGEYNLDHLQRFHWALFRDVYEWAGKTRTVDISREGARFCHWKFVDDEVSAVLSGLERDNRLFGLRREKFVERTQRAFLRQLSAAAGWRLDWSALNKEDNIAASKHNLQTADTHKLIEVLEPVVARM